MIKKIVLVISLIVFSLTAKSNDSHDHDHEDESHKEKSVKVKKTIATEEKDSADDGHEHGESHADHDDEHNDDHARGHDDEHGEDEHGHGEENAQIGEDKGILEADKDKGFKISPEAEVNFKVEKIKVQSSEGVEIPKKALVTSTIEVNVYRYREGFYKRIDFETISKSTTGIKIKSKDIKQGDEIATTGLGFLRVTEIAAFDGAPEGHSH